TQTEYYRLFAFFNNQDEPTLTVYPSEAVAADLEDRQSVAERAVSEWLQSQAEAFAAWEEQLAEPEKEKLSAALKKILDLPPEQRSGSQTHQLYAGTLGREDKEFQQRQKQLKAVEAEIKQLPTTLVMAERREPRQTTLLIKGDFTRPAAVVTPGTPAVLPPLPSPNDASNASDTTAQADRLALARWIVSPENPLTARVIVNRVWQVYFGRGLVETENDFGTLGTPPSHPRLLDWLAVELQRKQWSLKELHRLIVLSHTYRQASTVREDLQAVDPHNYLLGRQQRLRLEAEIIRDVSLAASGLLSPKLGGPPVFPPIPEGVMNQGQVTRDWNVSAGEDRYRRGIYTFVYRATPPPSLNVFDAPDGYSTCTRRARSNTPLQALTLLNDAAFFELATALEKIIRQDGLEQAFRRCTARPPSDEERALLSQLDPQSAARVLLNLDETMTRE
ncbi:MAG: DUF1553 domain-containing protein, partial [Planctomycetales bacterium]|nr:DUF1553 domain-containing protein [Planctomycetales bacterium]